MAPLKAGAMQPLAKPPAASPMRSASPLPASTAANPKAASAVPAHLHAPAGQRSSSPTPSTTSPTLGTSPQPAKSAASLAVPAQSSDVGRGSVGLSSLPGGNRASGAPPPAAAAAGDQAAFAGICPDKSLSSLLSQLLAEAQSTLIFTLNRMTNVARPEQDIATVFGSGSAAGSSRLMTCSPCRTLGVWLGR